MKEYETFINGEPINKVISNRLHFETPNEPPVIKKNICGTLSWNMDNNQLNQVFLGLDNFSSLLEQERVRVEELMKKVDEYLDDKCREYCKKNNLSFEQWRGLSVEKCPSKNCWEIYYLGDLVCGAKINAEIKDINTYKATISIELY